MVGSTGSNETKRYKRSPIREAVCEVRFTRDTPWDLTVPGLLYEKLQSDFPKREDRLVTETVSIVPQNLQPGTSFQFQVQIHPLVVFYAQDPRLLTQIGDRQLVVSILKPYPGWHAFKSLVTRAWDAITEVVSAFGGGVHIARIGLRYINEFSLNLESANQLQTWFSIYPHLPGHALAQALTFSVGAELPFREGKDLCRVQFFKPHSPDPGSFPLILDFDYMTWKEVPAAENFLSWLEEAHRNIVELFESSITDDLRQDMGVEQ